MGLELEIPKLKVKSNKIPLNPSNPRPKVPMPEKIKQVIIIRKDLKTRRGKDISQGAHASLSCILQLMTRKDEKDSEFVVYIMELHKKLPVEQWISQKFTKICVYVNSEEELLNVYKQAKDTGILCSLIQDSGDTEFHGVPTYTAVAIGPDFSKNIDPITGKLPLL